MFRSVLVIIFVIIVIWLARTLLQRVQQKPDNNRPLSSKRTVQCVQCSTYIPEEDAIMQDNRAFCSKQHLNDWKQSN